MIMSVPELAKKVGVVVNRPRLWWIVCTVRRDCKTRRRVVHSPQKITSEEDDTVLTEKQEREKLKEKFLKTGVPEDVAEFAAQTFPLGLLGDVEKSQKKAEASSQAD